MSNTIEIAAQPDTVRKLEKLVQRWTRRGGQFAVTTPEGEKIVTLVTLRKGLFRRPYLWDMDLGSRQKIPNPSTNKSFFKHSALKSEVFESGTNGRKLTFSPEPENSGDRSPEVTPTEADVQSRLNILKGLRRRDRFDLLRNVTVAEKKRGVLFRPLP